MQSRRTIHLLQVALLVLCFGLAAYLEVHLELWRGNHQQSDDVLAVLLGDGRRLFANHFFVKADAYFHSGFYPTIFDNREAFETPHMAEDSGTVGGHNHGDEEGFLGPPRDWIDAFSRHFYPSVHTHLDEGGARGHLEPKGDLGDGSEVREILPWLKLSAELDPNRVETYTVTAYWLRRRLGKVAEAEQFLREGLRDNPNSYEILFELGRIYDEDKHDPVHARNLWEAALSQWHKQQSTHADPDKFLLLQITSRLAKLEEAQGHYPEALRYMELWRQCAPNPLPIQAQIDELRRKAAQDRAPKGP